MAKLGKTSNENESWYAVPLTWVIFFFSWFNFLFGNLFLSIVGLIGIIWSGMVLWAIHKKKKEERKEVETNDN